MKILGIYSLFIIFVLYYGFIKNKNARKEIKTIGTFLYIPLFLYVILTLF